MQSHAIFIDTNLKFQCLAFQNHLRLDDWFEFKRYALIFVTVWKLDCPKG